MEGVLKVESYGDIEDGARFDFVVVGSGFGGSVAALRLAEKGYSVAVLESGRHFEDGEFPKTNWNLPRYLWMPRLFCYGIQRLTWLKDVLIVSGAGVGGGSLVYANTLLEPGDAFYDSPAVRRLGPGFRERLKPHFETAKRMLGVATAPRLFAADETLRACAEEMGRGQTFQAAEVGVFFGEPGREVPDPYFGGEGPPRAGCTFCGGCMVGCRHNAKNTLVKNYLHFAVKKGARIFSLSRVRRVEERDGGRGFDLTVSPPGWSLGRKMRIEAGRLIVSAGVLGTMRLLLDPANRLPRMPARLGRDVRTNAEELLACTSRGGEKDQSQGLAIASGFWPDDATHVEAVRYSAGSDAIGLLSVRKKGSGRAGDALRMLLPFGWAKRTAILLCMQTTESRLRLGLKRALFGAWLQSSTEPGAEPPVELAAAGEVLRRFCLKEDGIAQISAAGAFKGISTTAHIMGGAAMGAGPEDGVTDLNGRVFGYENLWVLDGSIIPANLGVNPSLTITALAEHAMASIEEKV